MHAKKEPVYDDDGAAQEAAAWAPLPAVLLLADAYEVTRGRSLGLSGMEGRDRVVCRMSNSQIGTLYHMTNHVSRCLMFWWQKCK